MGNQKIIKKTDAIDDPGAAFKLENQLCFPLYAASRLVTKCYQPILDELAITYPQYLVLIVLWESDGVNLNFLADKLKLQSNTLTPLLKRMESMKLVERKRLLSDERNVIISLTPKGQDLKEQAPRLHNQLAKNLGIDLHEALQLKDLLNKLINNIVA